MLKPKYLSPNDPAQTVLHPALSANGHSNGAAPVAPLLWLPTPNEAILFPLVVNFPGAAVRAFLLLTSTHFTGHAARLFEAAQSIEPRENLTPDSLAAECNRRASDAATQSEADTWTDCAAIALSDLTHSKCNSHDPRADAERIARKIAKEATPRFTLKTLEQLDAEPDPEWLIHGFLTQGGTSLLTAKHGSYKSFFALEMALCVACDFPFHNHEIRPGLVVYVAAEGASGIKKRARAWREHHGQCPGENFVVLDVPLQIHDEQIRAAFSQQVADLKPALIIFDTLARCAVGLDENNAGDMGRFADALGALARATGAHVLTVHHNAKGGEYRGSTAIPAAVDTHITLSKGEGKNASVTLEMPKQKDFEALYPITFEPLEVAFIHKGKPASSLVFVKGENATGEGEGLGSTERKALESLKAIASEAGATSSQWQMAAEDAGVKGGAYFRAIKRLMENGAVVAVSGSHGKRGATYAPASEPSQNKTASLPHSHAPTPTEGGSVGVSVGSEGEEPIAPTLPLGAIGSVGDKPKKKRAKSETVANSEPYGAAPG